MLWGETIALSDTDDTNSLLVRLSANRNSSDKAVQSSFQVEKKKSSCVEDLRSSISNESSFKLSSLSFLCIF